MSLLARKKLMASGNEKSTETKKETIPVETAEKMTIPVKTVENVKTTDDKSPERQRKPRQPRDDARIESIIQRLNELESSLSTMKSTTRVNTGENFETVMRSWTFLKPKMTKRWNNSPGFVEIIKQLDDALKKMTVE